MSMVKLIVVVFLGGVVICVTGSALGMPALLSCDDVGNVAFAQLEYALLVVVFLTLFVLLSCGAECGTAGTFASGDQYKERRKWR